MADIPKGGKFVVNTETVGKILKSDEIMQIGLDLAADKFQTIETNYVGTQRCWIEGIEHD